MTQKFAVIGTPIAHSLSPAIHNAIFAHEGRDGCMTALDPDTPRKLGALLDTWLCDQTHEGLAVTAPYKPLIASLGGVCSEAVQALRVANTLTLKRQYTVHPSYERDEGSCDTSSDGALDTGYHWEIDNTDVAGFTHAVQKLLSPLAYRTFVVFGTGATARTIIYALIKEGAASIHVVGRSRAKAEECAAAFSAASTTTDLIVATAPPGKHFDCAINATTLGLSVHDELIFPSSWFAEYTSAVLDVVYRRVGTTRLVNECRQKGVSALDGRVMLYAQAVYQARLWGATCPEDELMDVARHACETCM